MNAALEMRPSAESELDREIETLIGKLAHGLASPNDLERLHVLSSQRARLMQPASVQRFRGLALGNGGLQPKK